jgi:Lipid A 3-O-deacylase (PagL)
MPRNGERDSVAGFPSILIFREKNTEAVNAAMGVSKRFSKIVRLQMCVWIGAASLMLAAQTAISQSGAALPSAGPSATDETAGSQTIYSTRTGSGPESELVATGLSSVGHIHIFANSWWSYLSIAGIEYDRHSWGHAAGARMDYSAEFQPMVLLWQPTKTSVWGTTPAGNHDRELLYGIGVMPIGLRMIWRDGTGFKPYFLAKGGVLGFDKKALSSQSSYMEYSLLLGVGTQFRLASRWDGRVGFTFFHFSNGFIVPSNPGLDSATYSVGIAYHLGGAH